MKVYGTIDDKGVDGFGFKKSDKSFRKLRACINSFRGMEYFEFNINKKEKEEMIKLAHNGQWKELGIFVRKKEI